MKNALITLLLALFAPLAVAAAAEPAPADDALKIIAADPGINSTLGRQQPLYVWFELKTPEGGDVDIHPYYRGEPVIDDLTTSAPAHLPPGGGSAVANLFFWGSHTTPVDELRFVVSVPGSPPTVVSYSRPVQLQWTADDPVAHEPAPWVRDWQHSEAERAHGQPQLRPADTVFGGVFALVMALIALSGLGLPLWAAARWHGNWRNLAVLLFALPLADAAWIVIRQKLLDARYDHPAFQVACFLAFSAAATVIAMAARALLRRGPARS